jgi:hypothetical protein
MLAAAVTGSTVAVLPAKQLLAVDRSTWQGANAKLIASMVPLWRRNYEKWQRRWLA